MDSEDGTRVGCGLQWFAELFAIIGEYPLQQSMSGQKPNINPRRRVVASLNMTLEEDPRLPVLPRKTVGDGNFGVGPGHARIVF